MAMCSLLLNCTDPVAFLLSRQRPGIGQANTVMNRQVAKTLHACLMRPAALLAPAPLHCPAAATNGAIRATPAAAGPMQQSAKGGNTVAALPRVSACPQAIKPPAGMSWTVAAMSPGLRNLHANVPPQAPGSMLDSAAAHEVSLADTRRQCTIGFLTSPRSYHLTTHPQALSQRDPSEQARVPCRPVADMQQRWRCLHFCSAPAWRTGSAGVAAGRNPKSAWRPLETFR